MQNTLQISNSFCRLIGFPKTAMVAVDEILTYRNDIDAQMASLNKQKKFFEAQLKKELPPQALARTRKKVGWIKKQMKDLKASEFVKWLRGDKFPSGHLNIVKDTLEAIGHEYKIKDLRVVPEKKWNFTLCKDFHVPRYYQDEMHVIGMREKRGVFESAVGTGKSLILMRLLLELGVTSLIVVPSKPLMNQLKKELVKHFGRRSVEVCSSATVQPSKLRKLKKRPIRLINIQSLASLNKKGEAGKILHDVNALFIDEIHHAGSKSYTDLLMAMDHIYYRFGFTGTFLRNDSKTLDMWGFLSNKLYSYPAWKAIEEGYLTPMKVLIHELEGIERRKYQKEYDDNYCGGEAFLEKIHHILKKKVKENEQVLILVNRKDKSGLVIHEFLSELGFENTYISGDDDKDVIDEALSDFNDKTIRILVGSTVIGEGIDIRSTDHLIMAQGGKSEIAIVQAAGRLVRLFEGKIIGWLHDFRFTETKYMEKHFEMRRDILERNFSPKFLKAS